jgi:hypothetical protein
MAKKIEKEEEESKWLQWPTVPPKMRPKTLYVNEFVSPADSAHLAKVGWNVVDTRVMPNSNSTEHLEAIKAVLEGIRIGSIDAEKGLKDFLDQELYLLGVKGKGTQTDRKGGMDKEALDSLLDLGKDKVGEQLAQKRSKFAAVDFNDLFALSNKRGEKLAKGVVLAVPLKTNGLLGFLVRLYVRLSKKALVATWEQTHIPPTRDSRSLSIDID